MNCVGPSRTKESCAEDGRGSGPGPPARTPRTSAEAAKESATAAAALRGSREDEEDIVEKRGRLAAAAAKAWEEARAAPAIVRARPQTSLAAREQGEEATRASIHQYTSRSLLREITQY